MAHKTIITFPGRCSLVAAHHVQAKLPKSAGVVTVKAIKKSEAPNCGDSHTILTCHGSWSSSAIPNAIFNAEKRLIEQRQYYKLLHQGLEKLQARRLSLKNTSEAQNLVTLQPNELDLFEPLEEALRTIVTIPLEKIYSFYNQPKNSIIVSTCNMASNPEAVLHQALQLALQKTRTRFKIFDGTLASIRERNIKYQKY